ncbi:TetR/AcrR family transcriptional regulator [Alkalihalobacillus sp. CinArs1]|uniref:TetR/AcrR family transcriptional regulator n=1 Tax=Alkalihalobacillus sp. CinArs1 TaxID=2995314 RepID=UPI0022DE5EC4|nr:TetR/AcrR family transcriptional regulator [Alkalihalobacillus sp. CinArs1]
MSPKVSKEHKEQRRAELLEAAKTVFIERGYERATMKHIMEEANVSRGGLYQYFSSKEDVYEAILKEGLETAMEDTEEVLKKEELTHWALLMKRLFGEEQELDEMDPMAPSNLEFFITGRNDERRRKYGKERYFYGLSIYHDVIKKGQESGEFSSKFDSEMIARSIISFVDGLALDYAILDREDIKLKEQSIMFIEYLKMALEVKE